jgi:hypothetical protein
MGGIRPLSADFITGEVREWELPDVQGLYADAGQYRVLVQWDVRLYVDPLDAAIKRARMALRRNHAEVR